MRQSEVAIDDIRYVASDLLWPSKKKFDVKKVLGKKKIEVSVNISSGNLYNIKKTIIINKLTKTKKNG
jgi:hypothetical protein